MKVLANDGISSVGKDMLVQAGFEVITDKVEQSALIDYVNANQIGVIVVRSATQVRKDVFDNCPSVKLVCRGGVGMDNIDVEYGRSKGVVVANTPASSSQSVAELVMGHLFAAARFLNDSYKNMETGDFSALKKKYGKGTELRNKTLVIVGFGRIGQSLASYALGCGMDVIAVDFTEYTVEVKVPIGTQQEVKVPITTVTNLNAELPKADFISLHVPKQTDESAVIKAAEIDLMKPTAFIANAARGGVVNEQDLIEALNANKIAGAVLDVFENEPNPKKELLSHTKIATSPHIGAATIEAQDRIGEELAQIVIQQFGTK